MAIANITNNILTDSGTLISSLATSATTISTTSPLQGGGDLSANRTLSITQSGTASNGYLSSTDWNTFNGKGSGTVTSVAALTIGTTGTDLSSSVANSTTTPVITLNVPTASATNRGALSSADWTTFNNKQNALTNPVLASGTWTSGYLPKINGTYTIGNSLVYDNGNNIKITTTDYSPFYVNSTNANNWGSNIVFQQSGTDFGYFGALGSLLGSTDKGMTIYANTGNSIYLYTSGSNRLQVFSGGNIGIGTGGTDSGYKLDVNGTGRFTGNTNGEQTLQVTNSNSGVSAVALLNLSNDASVAQFVYSSSTYTTGYTGIGANTLAIINRSSTGGGIKFITGGYTDSQTRLTIASTGAATFSAKISVRGGTNQGGYYMDYQSDATSRSFRVSSEHLVFGDFVIQRSTTRTGTTYEDLLYFDANRAATFSSSVTATSFFESSSIKGKDIIATNPLLSLDIDVIKYTRKSDESKDIRYGYSAEQIHSLMPELTDKDVTAVKYLDVHTILISQLQKEIKELKAKMN